MKNKDLFVGEKILKTSLRRAIEHVYRIDDKSRDLHYIFDNVSSDVDKSKSEGYNTYLIGKELGRESLYDAFIQEERVNPYFTYTMQTIVSSPLCLP
uniref:Uncharacterized protein n=1 Tax=Pithovirus LCDPAC01 TaxID=2506600 RepID=A0A481YQG7_9VIRU|nr:MAG: hypothetical protein LCDPAC01_01440 [Pithovirus LCDPAC01]